MLRFTSTDNECCNPGDRIPILFLNGFVEKFQFSFQVGDNDNYVSHSNKVELQLKTWTKIEIKQYSENEKVTFS